jgi:hypothetical protein
VGCYYPVDHGRIPPSTVSPCFSAGHAIAPTDFDLSKINASLPLTPGRAVGILQIPYYLNVGCQSSQPFGGGSVCGKQCL